MNPTPTPTANPTIAPPTPTATPTSTPSAGSDFTCRIRPVPGAITCRQSLYTTVLTLERSALNAGESIVSSLSCNATGQALAATLHNNAASGANVNNAPFGNGFATFTVQEPRLNDEALCIVRVASSTRPGACEYAVAARACDLGCQSSDSLATQLAVDGGITAQFKQLKTQAQTLAKLRKRYAKDAKRYIAQGQALFEDGWRGTYQFPRVTQSCTNTTQCSLATLSDARTTMRTSAAALRTLTLKVHARVVKLTPLARRKKVAAQKERIQSLYDSTVEHIDELPENRSICG